ncbi:hypothetical protein GJAV_G00148690 [Gymnothorax javanicus]|nr:hypothetical protein GJAV_G00148690 [Gymnothorax javanicus]
MRNAVMRSFASRQEAPVCRARNVGNAASGTLCAALATTVAMECVYPMMWIRLNTLVLKKPCLLLVCMKITRQSTQIPGALPRGNHNHSKVKRVRTV